MQRLTRSGVCRDFYENERVGHVEGDYGAGWGNGMEVIALGFPLALVLGPVAAHLLCRYGWIWRAHLADFREQGQRELWHEMACAEIKTEIEGNDLEQDASDLGAFNLTKSSHNHNDTLTVSIHCDLSLVFDRVNVFWGVGCWFVGAGGGSTDSKEQQELDMIFTELDTNWTRGGLDSCCSCQESCNPSLVDNQH